MLQHETEQLFNREQAAVYLDVSVDSIDYYKQKLPPDRRLIPDFKQKKGRTFEYVFKKSTLDKFKESLRSPGRPKKVQE